MKDTEQILADLAINNPTDSAMIRLAGAAVSMPGEDAETLVKRVNFTHPRDAKLALGIVSAIRANAGRGNPPPVKRFPFAAVAFATLAAGLAGWVVVASRSLSDERSAREQQLQRFTKEVADLQAASGTTFDKLQSATASALKQSGESTKETTALFTTTIGQQTERIAALAAENEKLKAEREQLRADLAAARTPKIP
jgi:septal ring factor EnvC (AmiA/AmiB activator)